MIGGPYESNGRQIMVADLPGSPRIVDGTLIYLGFLLMALRY